MRLLRKDETHCGRADNERKDEDNREEDLKISLPITLLCIALWLSVSVIGEGVSFHYTYNETDALLEIGSGEIASAFIAVPSNYILTAYSPIEEGQTTPDEQADGRANERDSVDGQDEGQADLAGISTASVVDGVADVLFICTNEDRTHAFSVQRVGEGIDDPLDWISFDANGIPGRMYSSFSDGNSSAIPRQVGNSADDEHNSNISEHDENSVDDENGAVDVHSSAIPEYDEQAADEILTDEHDALVESYALFTLSDGETYLLYELMRGNDDSILNNIFPVFFDSQNGYHTATTEQEIEQYRRAIDLVGRDMVCTGKNVRLRLEPTQDSRGIGMLGKGGPVRILECRGDWVRVRSQAGEGWIKMEYVSFQ